MKKIIKTFLIVLVCLCLISFVSCTCSDSIGTDDIEYYLDDSVYRFSSGESGIVDSIGGFISRKIGSLTGETKEYAPSDESTGTEETGEDETIDDSSDKEENDNQTVAHQLSASAYNDNDHYEFWKTLLKSGQTEEENGVFYSYYKEYTKYFKTLNRIKVSFNTAINAKVSLMNGKKEAFTTYTNKNGIAYLFADEYSDEYTIKVTYTNTSGEETSFTDTINGDVSYDKEALANFEKVIDLLFVIDTTGSMCDEITYLQAEVADVIDRISNENDNDVTINLGIIVYRDESDTYVVRSSDFTTDIAKQQNFLKKQSADGGGDFEEAVYKALEKANDLSWHENSTKVLVHVADAPSHDDEIKKWNDATLSLAEKGVRIITVASSGIDKLTEYFFRCQSMLTGGIYTYLTNDSGIGGDHITATTEVTPEVEYLNDMLVRLINGYYTGDFGSPVVYDKKVEETDPQE